MKSGKYVATRAQKELVKKILNTPPEREDWAVNWVTAQVIRGFVATRGIWVVSNDGGRQDPVHWDAPVEFASRVDGKPLNIGQLRREITQMVRRMKGAISE